MDSVIAAVVIFFLLIFGVLTFSNTTFSAHEVTVEAWQDMAERAESQLRTSLAIADAYTANLGGDVYLMIENTGSLSLSEFQAWDVISQYYANPQPYDYAMSWFDYGTGELLNGMWTVTGIYLDAAALHEEAYEPGILNPGEYARLHIRIDPGAGEQTPLFVQVSTLTGIGNSRTFLANALPQVATNLPVSVNSGEQVTIDAGLLQITDADDSADALSFSVTTSPTQGTLSLDPTWTQTDINDGSLRYTHSGSGDDSFEVSVTDGKDTITGLIVSIAVNEWPAVDTNTGVTLNSGDDSFEVSVTDGKDTITGLIVSIAVNEWPAVDTNTGVTLNSGETAVIDWPRLHASDADHPAEQLRYQITQAPIQGTLSLGSTFTQSDIDGGLLSYTHTGVGSDAFSFTISDGSASIGPFTFTITVNG